MGTRVSNPLRPRLIVACVAACGLAAGVPGQALARHDGASGFQQIDLERGRWQARSVNDVPVLPAVSPAIDLRAHGVALFEFGSSGRDTAAWSRRDDGNTQSWSLPRSAGRARR